MRGSYSAFSGLLETWKEGEHPVETLHPGRQQTRNLVKNWQVCRWFLQRSRALGQRNRREYFTGGARELKEYFASSKDFLGWRHAPGSWTWVSGCSIFVWIFLELKECQDAPPERVPTYPGYPPACIFCKSAIHRCRSFSFRASSLYVIVPICCQSRLAISLMGDLVSASTTFQKGEK